jgi:hypothetical protein
MAISPQTFNLAGGAVQDFAAMGDAVEAKLYDQAAGFARVRGLRYQLTQTSNPVGCHCGLSSSAEVHL